MDSQKVILISGASSGIGKECFEFLKHQGHIVYGGSRKASKIDNMLLLDVTDEHTIAQAVDQIVSEQGRIDVIVNNAGISLVGAIEDTSVEEAQKIMDTNFWGVVNLTKQVLPIMRKQRSGMIINISSVAGLFSIPYQAYYSASKFALEGWTESLRMEVRSFGIKACLIEPGDFKTEISQNRIFAVKGQNGSVYDDGFEMAKKVIVEGQQRGDKPIRIAKLVAKLIHKKSPRIRYSIGKPLDLLAPKLKHILPQKLFERLIRNHYGI